FSIRESGSISEVGRRPRCSSRSLELRAPVSRDAHTGVEHGSFAGNLARLDAVCELLACRPLDAGSRTVEDAAAANESASHRPLQLLERPKQAVDRAARCILRSHVDADGQETTIAPIAGAVERNTVRLPISQ